HHLFTTAHTIEPVVDQGNIHFHSREINPVIYELFKMNPGKVPAWHM
ncbi:uncharacterized protein METZ01_LOCUS271490, partial [marine metagenome]